MVWGYGLLFRGESYKAVHESRHLTGTIVIGTQVA